MSKLCKGVRLKESCDGCRALSKVEMVCGLGYKMENAVPQEICPKPRTITEYMNCRVRA